MTTWEGYENPKISDVGTKGEESGDSVCAGSCSE